VDWEARYRALVDEIAAEFPRFRLIRKDASLLQRSIDVALRVLTLGGLRHYLDDFVTTLGQRVYVPRDFAERPARERWVTLRHERVHLRQFRRWGFPLMALAYLFGPLPFGLAWARMRLERAAYEESLRAAVEAHGIAHVCDAAYRAHVIALFTGPAYGWMWPFPRAMARWYDGMVAALARDERRR
jgi:hypothetical protein